MSDSFWLAVLSTVASLLAGLCLGLLACWVTKLPEN
jgi:uncharacterized protein YneF (UPF0154 family)